ncbi:hypothetical protein BAE44_0006503 [Dichanthelium oligosanthes]|uniref:Uncharacterized protein n=1 Tax=Dichanthelium oligosanthes TaxID=888268 RepID=A0A1E5W4Y5_9POAL|nr:hypothetical protein BAE44_0006503 [Dichanthelium oligosanthes]
MPRRRRRQRIQLHHPKNMIPPGHRLQSVLAAGLHSLAPSQGKLPSEREIFQPFHEIDPAIVRAHDKLTNKYFAKHEDGKLLRRTSGFLIDWDAESKTGTVLTSALLIRSKSPSVDERLGTDEYAPHAEVSAHLMDKTDTTVVADLLHYDKHYNLALFKIAIDLSAQLPSFTSELKLAEDVFVLGRDEGRNLSRDHGNVEYKGPIIFYRHHYMFISCRINKLENFLLDMREKHLDKGNSIGSSVDLSIGIFHIRNGSHGTIKMTVNVSDDVEVVAEGTYPVSAAHCALVDDDDDDDGVIQGEYLLFAFSWSLSNIFPLLL